MVETTVANIGDVYKVSKVKKLITRWIKMNSNEASFKELRESMGKHLFEDEDLYLTYQANIAMCIYDSRRKDGRLNHKECNDVAKKLIKIIWGE